MNLTHPIPLSLYIHFPWCVKKCPYCDFNSHTLKTDLPEEAYIDALLKNLECHLPLIWGRTVSTIFMGGGTPSLFSVQAIERLLEGIRARTRLLPHLEITLEANPGTVDQSRFHGYREIGINRISLGIQSFHNNHLAKLGRIHDSEAAKKAIHAILEAGFSNFNIDLMFGLPNQTITEGLSDLEQALAFQPPHLSWYELTLEPNTAFWQNPPPLPPEEHIAQLQIEGQALLATQGLQQYEVSAYCQNQPCRHNLNYWEFGDYLAIGAGSHGKITLPSTNEIKRFHHFRHPKQYLESKDNYVQEMSTVESKELPFEFMLNALRLKEGVPLHYFNERTGLSLETIKKPLQEGQAKGWLLPFEKQIATTDLGFQFLNDVINLF